MVQITRATTDTPLSLSHFRRLRTMVDLDCPEKISIILKHAPIVMESADCQEVIERAVIEKDLCSRWFYESGPSGRIQWGLANSNWTMEEWKERGMATSGI